MVCRKSSPMVCRKRPAKAPSTRNSQGHPNCACGKREQHRFEAQSYCSGCFLKTHPEAAKAASQKRHLSKDPTAAPAHVRAKCACGKDVQHSLNKVSY